MRKITLTITIALTTLAATAQEEIKLRVAYHSTYKEFKREKPLPTDTLIWDEQVLEIGKERSVFYSKKSVAYEEALKEQEKEHWMDFGIKWFRKQGQPYRIVRKLSKPELITCGTSIYNMKNKYLYEDTLERINWRIIKEDSIILGHKCRKAEGNFRGRHWTVWFAKDIKHRLGPWKLCGLPGLIVSAHESEGIFSFDCTSIEEDCGAMKELSFEDYDRCSLRHYLNEQIEYWHDSIAFMGKKSGNPEPQRGRVPDFEAILIETPNER